MFIAFAVTMAIEVCLIMAYLIVLLVSVSDKGLMSLKLDEVMIGLSMVILTLMVIMFIEVIILIRK